MKTYSLIRNETGKYNIQKIDLCLISRKKKLKGSLSFFSNFILLALSSPPPHLPFPNRVSGKIGIPGDSISSFVC